jgi:acyl transferase domain-containing protein
MPEPIAVVGSACRFPGGASSPSKLWDLLVQPRDVLVPFPKDRLNLDRFYHPNGEHHGSTDVAGGAYLLEDDYRAFDASFFNISPREAEGMDPQQRMLLESVYEALESAGYPLDRINGSKTSVHVGVMTADFPDIQLRDSETMAAYHATGTARSILSNRISYFFNLKGPSVTVDTACSSSLVALHQALQGLRAGDATAAVVAGANLILDPAMFIAESSLHMLSRDSRSRMWVRFAIHPNSVRSFG